MMRFLSFFIFLFLAGSALAQHQHFNRQDTLRGTYTAERAWWDLLHYDLHIAVDIDKKSIEGYNTVTFQVLETEQPMNVLQLDLQPPMTISRVELAGQVLPLQQDGNAWFITIPGEHQTGEKIALEVFFSGKPRVAKRPPWDGGFTWTKDRNGKAFIATSCQGDGASLWWPCKDHMKDEPEGMDMYLTVNDPELTAVANGRLISKPGEASDAFHWKVVNPINNYGVNINIGDYVNFSEIYNGEKGPLDCDYWVLRQDLDKAKEQFKQVPLMFQAFEHWFGPYPFYEDSYKLVQVPYLGMEHQSSVTYGNRYKNGYLGSDLSGSGWGLKFDFIIIHESGHEWFANSITNIDIADMWIHEGFTAYSENLFVDYHYGKEASSDYVIGTRTRIQNDKPIIGPYGVNKSGSGDMYYKGANTIHMLRQILDNDKRWRDVLRNLNQHFYHQTVSTKQVEDYLSEQLGRDLKPFFDQYLRDTRIPILEYWVNDKQLVFRWSNTVSDFNMPVKVNVNGRDVWIEPKATWKRKAFEKPINTVAVDRNFYISPFNLKGNSTK